MRVPFLFIVATFLAIALGAVTVRGKSQSDIVRPIPASQWTPKAKLWGARSCVGEAGFGTTERPEESLNECVSVMQVYAERYWMLRKSGRNWSLTKVIRRYSAAVKRHSTHERTWILELRADGRRPEHWPRELRWSVHKPLWEHKWRALDRWANGEIKSLTPEANHFGGDMDAHYAEHVRKWARVPTPKYYGNKFYNSRKLTGTPIIVPGRGERLFGNLVVAGPSI